MGGAPDLNPLAVTRSFTDTADYRISGRPTVDVEIINLGNQPFRADQIHLNLEKVSLIDAAVGQSTRSRARVPEDVFGFQLLNGPVPGICNGCVLDGDKIMAYGPGVDYHAILPHHYRVMNLYVPRRELELLASAAYPEILDALGPNSFCLRPDKSTLEQLRLTCVKTIGWATRESNSNANRDQIRGVLGRTLLEYLLATVNTARVEPRIADRGMAKQSHIVRQAEDYVMSHSGAGVYLSELCAITHTNERTLHDAFEKLLGMGPADYLDRFMLHKVHRALANGSPRSTTVAAEAMRYGYRDVDSFSQAYQTLFGQLPAATLARPSRRGGAQAS